MKKEKVYSIIITGFCFLLWFMPIEKANEFTEWIFSARILFGSIFSGSLFTSPNYYLREILIFIFGVIAIIALVVNIIKDQKITRLVSSIASIVYVLIWIVALFVNFPPNLTIYKAIGTIWLLLYIAILLAITTLLVLQYLPMLPPRPTKAARLQAQIDELQKQVDELKKGD